MQGIEDVEMEVDVSAAAVTAGATAADQSDVFECVEVMGEQVRADVEHELQLLG